MKTRPQSSTRQEHPIIVFSILLLILLPPIILCRPHHAPRHPSSPSNSTSHPVMAKFGDGSDADTEWRSAASPSGPRDDNPNDSHLSGDADFHLSRPDVAEVPPPTIDGQSRMRRRHRPSPKRRHRLLLKTRRGDHLTGLLRSDGPGHVIFKAGEVKKDWCRTIPFEQNITSGRCSKIVKNNLCYGQCNSFFIPQSEKGSSKVAFQSCAFCKPHRLRWVKVNLDCPGRRVVQKTILKVESCRCIAADAKDMEKNAEYLKKGAKNIRVNQ